MMQRLLTLDDGMDAPSESYSLGSVLPSPDGKRRVTEIDRLTGELARIQARLNRIESVRVRLSAEHRKLVDRAASIGWQIESLEKNPLAILRYQTSVPQQYQGRLWCNQPVTELRLESISGLGMRRMRILYDRCPTIGDMEVLRVYEGLTTVPGIGALVAARIEKKLLAWLECHAFGYMVEPSREHLGRTPAGMPKEVRL